MNAACSAALPPIIPTDYKLQGKYEDIAGLKTYITGSDPTIDITGALPPCRGLIFAYDVFGLLAPTLQGADRLAQALNAVVLVPDFFEGAPIPLNILPADTDEKKALRQAFMEGKAGVVENGERLSRVRAEAGRRFEGVQGWGVFGLCWGGKLAALASGEGTAFKASGTAHPGRLALSDATQMTIPHICLFAPEDGTPGFRKEYGAALRQRNPQSEVEEYADMFHGWMGGRARLDEEVGAREFARG
ncbi:hypothetical protein MMC27_007099 [Xylographa pallens]|nr:hypothetical protein [Xylographa pallens]